MSIEFKKNVKCCPEFVAVEILENFDNLNLGGIVLPESFGFNERLAFAKILNCGSTAAFEYDLNPGDYVMIDRLSTFGHTKPIATLSYKNVICKTNENNSEYFPLKNMLFVKPIKKSEEQKIGNIYIAGTYNDKLNIGIIYKVNFDKNSKFEKQELTLGTKVVLTTCKDIVSIGNSEFFIYSKDQIVCKIMDD